MAKHYQESVSGEPCVSVLLIECAMKTLPVGHEEFVFFKQIKSPYSIIILTRGFLLSLKCTRIKCGWAFAPNPTGGAYSASPYLLAWSQLIGPSGLHRQWFLFLVFKCWHVWWFRCSSWQHRLRQANLLSRRISWCHRYVMTSKECLINSLNRCFFR